MLLSEVFTFCGGSKGSPLFISERETMIEYARLAALLYDAPLLLSAEKASVFDQVFRDLCQSDKPHAVVTEPTAERAAAKVVEAMSGERLRRSDAGYLITQDGIAMVPVLGSLMQRSSGLDGVSGITSYQTIGAMFAAAEADPLVRGVVMDIDSPGGEVAGAFELASQIRKSKKPVYAVANEFATSAAYLLASAADTLNVPETGIVGSIGVVTMHVDQSKANEKRGLAVTHIYAGERKVDYSPHAPLSDTARAQAQDRVEKLYTLFVDTIGRDGRVDSTAARGTDAAVYSAADALDAGLIDGVGTLSETVSELRNELNSARFSGGTYYSRRAGRAANLEGVDMSDTKAPATISAEDLNAAKAESLAQGRAEGVKEGKAEGAKEATAAERARIKEITMHADAVQRPKAALHLAFETEMTAEAAVAMLANIGAEATATPTNALAAAMAQVPNPKVGADTDKSDPTKVVPIIKASNIYAKRAEQARGAK